ncbi:hypothetical protein [Paramagnetospirillum magneticum]|uniref:Uncharacterized protein n=1 Tax=Paramagnetospirillum magneticum (strain ATCC 700264 / AMB-1) TaxID=342108 RepID=Q2W4I9_PARM1|nr:hypothetical protein [Paramagnetospirillum magneticum]BAE51211.1 hypothetical protein amb2407 [Paramagnetospirillum magneticum AMB-1]BAE51236.1 hypothetical protein amb2432 [Paramagnetospirillum magneticum AMB-1]
MAILGGDSSSSSSSVASNQISFNPIITALTGTGSTTPTVTAPQSLTPTSSALAYDGADSLSLPTSLLGGGAGQATRGAIGAGQTIPGVTTDPNAVQLGVKTNPQTMIWVLLFGGFALVMLTGGGGRR